MFLLDELHRFLMLFFFTFLATHVITVLIDPYTRFRLADVVVPFGSDYRRTWMGLGIVAAETAIALALTVHLRGLVGYRTWRLLHFATYSIFPLAALHSLGTGTDARDAVEDAVYAIFTAVVGGMFIRRALGGRRPVARVRGVTVGLVLGCLLGLGLWAARGPLAPGWSRIAGTPQHATVVVTRLSPPPQPSASASTRAHSLR